MGFQLNLEGLAPTKTFVPEDAYEAVITDIGEIREFVNSFKNEKTGKIEEKKQEKFPIEWTIKTKGDYMDKVITQFVSTKISKGSGTYSDSKLYELLNKANLLAQFTKDNRLLDDEIMAWLKQKLPDRLARITVKTTISKKDGSRYSTVKDIIKFLDVPEQIKMSG